jgi:hypothetical protein
MGVDPEIKAITSIEKGLAYLRHHDVIEVHLLRKAPTRIKLTASLNFPLSSLLRLTCTVNVLSTAHRHVQFSHRPTHSLEIDTASLVNSIEHTHERGITFRFLLFSLAKRREEYSQHCLCKCRFADLLHNCSLCCKYFARLKAGMLCELSRTLI